MILHDLDLRLRLKNAARRMLGKQVLATRETLAADDLPQLSARCAALTQQSYRMLVVCDSRKVAEHVLGHFERIAARHGFSARDVSFTPGTGGARMRVQLRVRCNRLQRAGLARFSDDIGNFPGVRCVRWETYPQQSARLH